MKAWLDKLRNMFADLAPRERGLVSTVAGLFAVIVAWFGLIVPALDAASRITGGVETAERELELTRRLRAEYDELAQRLAGVEQRIQRSPRGSLRTKLETLAAQASIKVDSMEPQTAPASDRYKETKVEVTLKQVDLPRIGILFDQIGERFKLLIAK